MEPILGCANFIKAFLGLVFFFLIQNFLFSLGCKIDYLYSKVFQISDSTKKKKKISIIFIVSKNLLFGESSDILISCAFFYVSYTFIK
jgi:hypothetical protein